MERKELSAKKEVKIIFFSLFYVKEKEEIYCDAGMVLSSLPSSSRFLFFSSLYPPFLFFPHSIPVDFSCIGYLRGGGGGVTGGMPGIG